MRQTVELAKAHGVAIGAHPGFPDLGGFGRRRMDATLDEFKNYITYQIGALQAFATALDVEINHCKPHGAMYMMAMEDEKIARVILEAVAEINPKMIVSAMNNSAVVHVAETICIHRDTPGAPELVKTILETFKAKDIEVTPARQVLASK